MPRSRESAVSACGRNYKNGADTTKNFVLIYIVSRIAEDQVAKLLKDSGVAADKEQIATLKSKLSGKSFPALIAEGSSKFASMPSGGAASAPAQASAPAKEEKAAPKKEEKKPVEEEEDLDMGDLFGY